MVAMNSMPVVAVTMLQMHLVSMTLANDLDWQRQIRDSREQSCNWSWRKRWRSTGDGCVRCSRSIGLIQATSMNRTCDLAKLHPAKRVHQGEMKWLMKSRLSLEPTVLQHALARHCCCCCLLPLACACQERARTFGCQLPSDSEHTSPLSWLVWNLKPEGCALLILSRGMREWRSKSWRRRLELVHPHDCRTR